MIKERGSAFSVCELGRQQQKGGRGIDGIPPIRNPILNSLYYYFKMRYRIIEYHHYIKFNCSCSNHYHSSSTRCFSFHCCSMEEKRYVITLTLAALSWLSFFCWIVVFATTHYVEKMY